MNIRKSMYTTILIGASFLWMGSAYLTLMHRLAEYCNEDIVYLMTESFGGYGPQIVGLLLFALIMKMTPKVAMKKSTLSVMMGLDGLFIIMVVAAKSASLLILSGIMSNLFHGLIQGAYLCRLSLFSDAGYRGRSFGIGYAFGTIGTFLLSLPGKGNFIYSPYVVYAYLALILATIVITQLMAEEYTDADVSAAMPSRSGLPKWGGSLLLPVAVVFLLSFVNQMLFYFPAMSYYQGSVSVELSRAFTAIGLLIAAVINDRSRAGGLLLSLMAMLYSILSLPLGSSAGTDSAAFLCAMGYLVLGLHVIFRVVVTADIADDHHMPELAVVGLIAGRFGDSCGSLTGYLVGDNQYVMIGLSVTLIAVLMVLAARLYTRDYLKTLQVASAGVPVMEPSPSERASQEDFSHTELSVRERQVLELALQELTNKEIAASLGVSENTIKFHMRNILKKTGCENKAELVSKFGSDV